MITLLFDTETTGLPIWKEPSDSPDQPHIVDIACDLWDTETKERIDTFDAIINPGVPIPDEVAAIHGITTAIAEEQGIAPLEAHERFLAMVAQADMIAGHNISFDIRMQRIAAAKINGEKWENTLPTYCTMRMSTNICKILSDKPRHPEHWKWPKLGEAVQSLFGEEFEDAHRARPDLDATTRIYFHLIGLEH